MCVKWASNLLYKKIMIAIALNDFIISRTSRARVNFRAQRPTLPDTSTSSLREVHLFPLQWPWSWVKLHPLQSELIPAESNMIPFEFNMKHVKTKLIPAEWNLILTETNLTQVQSKLTSVESKLIPSDESTFHIKLTRAESKLTHAESKLTQWKEVVKPRK